MLISFVVSVEPALNSQVHGISKKQIMQIEMLICKNIPISRNFRIKIRSFTLRCPEDFLQTNARAFHAFTVLWLGILVAIYLNFNWPKYCWLILMIFYQIFTDRRPVCTNLYTSSKEILQNSEIIFFIFKLVGIITIMG